MVLTLNHIFTLFFGASFGKLVTQVFRVSEGFPKMRSTSLYLRPISFIHAQLQLFRSFLEHYWPWPSTGLLPKHPESKEMNVVPVSMERGRTGQTQAK